MILKVVIKKELVILLVLLLTGLLVFGIVRAFTGPSADPPAGAGLLSNTGTGLDVTGYVEQDCPSGWWSAGYGRLCMEQTERGAGTMYAAIAACQAVADSARVCEHNDFQQICGTGTDPYTNSSGWYGDHALASGGNWDDEFGTWNVASCNTNNDGPGQAASWSGYYHCCF